MDAVKIKQEPLDEDQATGHSYPAIEQAWIKVEPVGTLNPEECDPLNNTTIKSEPSDVPCDTVSHRYNADNHQTVKTKHSEDPVKTELHATCCHFETQTCLEAHRQTCVQSKEIPCYKCPAKFSTVDEFIAHSQYHVLPKRIRSSQKDKTERTPLVCDTCSQLFSTVDAYTMHARKCTIKWLLPKPTCTPRKRQEITCTLCSATFATVDEFVMHTEAHTKDIVTCGNCKQSFKSKNRLSKHVCPLPKRNTISCDVCSKSFSTVDSFILHSQKHMKY